MQQRLANWLDAELGESYLLCTSNTGVGREEITNARRAEERMRCKPVAAPLAESKIKGR